MNFGELSFISPTLSTNHLNTIYMKKLLNYFKQNNTPIIVGFALGVTYCLTLNAIENLIIKLTILLLK